LARKLRSQTVIREKLRRILWYKKFACKMLMKLTPYGCSSCFWLVLHPNVLHQNCKDYWTQDYEKDIQKIEEKFVLHFLCFFVLLKVNLFVHWNFGKKFFLFLNIEKIDLKSLKNDFSFKMQNLTICSRSI